MRNDTPRNIVRSRTTMSYAFEAAGRRVIRDVKAGIDPTPIQLALVPVISDVLERGRATKKTPTWTVSKKERRR